MAQQKIIPVSIPKEYNWIIEWLDDYKNKGNNASQFIRVAIAEKINQTKTEKDIPNELEKRIEKLEFELNKMANNVVYTKKEENVKIVCSNTENSSIIDNEMSNDLVDTASIFSFD
jgi:transcription initiation factor IIE alpha subunit